MKKHGFLFLFGISSVAEIISAGIGIPGIEMVAKPLIVLSLIGHYVVNTSTRSMLFLLALTCCWLGDVLLLFESQQEFFLIAGLLAFMVGHIFFILAYHQFMNPMTGVSVQQIQKLRLAFPIALAGTGLVVVLYPTLGDLRFPVVIYSVVLTSMVVTAIYRMGLTNSNSFWMVFSGALLFMASDAMLAINKFSHPFTGAAWLIMLTYCLAQSLIVTGILVHRGG